MRYLTFLLFLNVSSLSHGAACCVGGGPKSFLSLQRLQNYEIGLLSSFRDVFGTYNAYGELVESDKNQSLTLSFGANVRVNHWIESFLILPFAYRFRDSERSSEQRIDFGDAAAGVRFVLLESLFQDDWYPTVALVPGIKFPTGVVETLSDEGKVIPGTGNGSWEPFLSLELKKEYAPVTLLVSASFSGRLKKMAPNFGGSGEIEVKEGDRIEVSETVSLALSRQFNTALGAIQAYEFDRSIDGSPVPYSSSRVVSLTFSSSYFFNPYFSLTPSFDFAIPLGQFGVNQQAFRSLGVTAKYGFY